MTAVAPGFTLSEFHDVTGTRERVKALPGWLWMDAETVARQGFDAVMAGRPLEINGRVNQVIAWLGRVLPRRVLVALVKRTAKGYREV